MTTFERPDQASQHHNFIKMQQPETAKNVHVYLNGDKYFAGRKFVVNRRHISDFDGFLNQVTLGIKAPFGAVRNVYTPNAGHRVNDLQQLQSGMQLVAGGVERFRKMEYQANASKRRPPPRRNYLDIKLNHNRMNVSARWRKYVKDPCQIFVYGNGDINAPALRLLLIPRCMKTWDLVLGEITEKISLRTGQAVRKLYDMNFRLLGDPSELENGHYYVAVGTEKLKKFPYGEMHKGGSHALSPRKTYHQPLPPIKKAPKYKPSPRDEGEQSYAKMYEQKKHHREQQEETTVMGASAATGYRPLKTKKYKPQRPSGGPPTHEGETVFHAKPVKVKRASGHSTTVVSDIHPPSEESDGVFRTNSTHIKAEEIDEDEDTRVDLPIDQVPADEVEEEHLPSPREETIPDGDLSEQHIPDIQGEEDKVEDRNVDEVLEQDQHPSQNEGSPEVTETEEMSAVGAGEPDSATVEDSTVTKDQEEDEDVKAETPLQSNEEPSSSTNVIVAGNATIDLEDDEESTSAPEDAHPEEPEVASNKEESDEEDLAAAVISPPVNDESENAPSISSEEKASNVDQTENVDAENDVDDPITTQSDDDLHHEDINENLPADKNESNSSPVVETTENEPPLSSELTENEVPSSPDKFNPAEDDAEANLDSAQDVPSTEEENVSILNGVDKISNDSNGTPALEENEEGIFTEEVKEQDEVESNKAEDEQLDREASVTPSSPKPREEVAEAENETPEAAVTTLPASSRSEADGADVTVPDTDEEADKNEKNDEASTKDDDDLPADKSQNLEEEVSTARPASEALTVEDQPAPATPISKPSMTNGSATVVAEAKE